MVVIKITYADAGDKNPVKSLIRLRDLMASNLTSLLMDMARVLEQRSEEAFARGGYPTPWKPAQRVLKEGGKTLNVTGRFRDSHKIGNVDNLLRIAGQRLTFGSKTPYGKYHTSTSPRHKIPYRPVIQKDALLVMDLKAVMRAWELKQIQGAGFSGR